MAAEAAEWIVPEVQQCSTLGSARTIQEVTTAEMLHSEAKEEEEEAIVWVAHEALAIKMEVSALTKEVEDQGRIGAASVVNAMSIATLLNINEVLSTNASF